MPRLVIVHQALVEENEQPEQRVGVQSAEAVGVSISAREAGEELHCEEGFALLIRGCWWKWCVISRRRRVSSDEQQQALESAIE